MQLDMYGEILVCQENLLRIQWMCTLILSFYAPKTYALNIFHRKICIYNLPFNIFNKRYDFAIYHQIKHRISSYTDKLHIRDCDQEKTQSKKKTAKKKAA